MPPRLPSPAAVLSALTALIAVFAALTIAGPVSAHAQTTAPAVKRVAPPGYTLGFSASLTSAAGTRTRGTVTCPKGTMPLSGGAFVLDEELQVNLGDSFPAGSNWVVDIDNASATDATFQVIVTCARTVAHYKVVRAHPASLAPGSSESFPATCPTGSKPLGGGVSVASADGSPLGVAVNMADTMPSNRQWLVQEDNAGTTNASITAVVVCGSVPNYRVIVSRAHNVPMQSQALLKATCPAPTVVMGGGGLTDVLSLSANLAYSTQDEGFDWFVAINNATDASVNARAVVVCGT